MTSSVTPDHRRRTLRGTRHGTYRGATLVVRRGAPIAPVCAAVLVLMIGGCGMTQGAVFYMMGFGQRKIVPAKYELTKQPVLVLVDDLAGQVDWPPAIHYLTDDLSQELIKRGAAGKIIPRRTLANLRRDHDGYDKLSAQQIGRLAEAEQVLWIEVREYFADAEIFEPTNAAYFAVTVKVINPHEKKERSRVRLWPVGPRGRYVNATLSSDAVHRAGTQDAIARTLATELAEKIARLFYDYRPGDFERVE